MRAFLSVEGDHTQDIIFDPQTAGGLLAGVPAAQVETCLASLKEAGFSQSCVIGEVVS